jgi:hypothetical protein
LKHPKKQHTLKQGDVVIIKGEEINRNKWKLAVGVQMIKGRDDVMRAVKLRAGKSFLERPIQFLYPLELSCDMEPPKTRLNVEAKEFAHKRKAAISAQGNIRKIAEEEEQSD